MYDVIISGGRCAGAPLALLLARRGARVLLVDRTTFPSDTMNGHYITAAGVKRLAQWGLLDRVLDSATAEVRQHRYHFGPTTIAGNLIWPDGEPAFGLAPRRKRLDAVLVDAAVEAGVELRQGFSVDDVVWDGSRVVGIRGREGGSMTVVEQAKLVVGADGLRSRVAAAVGAAEYEALPPRTCVYYSYWADWPGSSPPALTVYDPPNAYAITFPTDDNQMCVAVGWPAQAFNRVRADVEQEFLAVIGSVPRLAERVRAARRVERFRGTADLPFFLRTPRGPGWALVGDAGCRVDPITGQGITDAFRDVDLLAEAISAGLSGSTGLDAPLADYHRRRDEAVRPIYRFTSEQAQLRRPSPRTAVLLAAVASSQYHQDRFAGVSGGTTPIGEFFSAHNIARVLADGAAQAAA
jgi:2-polyprenyl-6-methoxyphenol hydroxylase-like FAD-dependent oxidoreductase